MPSSADSVTGRRVAVAAEVLYLLNLLLLPGLAFIALLALYLWQRTTRDALARAHLAQTVRASLWAGVLLTGGSALLFYSGLVQEEAWRWVAMVLYFTTCHAALVLLGAFGLAQAIAGRRWRYPLVGVALDDSRPAPGGAPR